MPTNTASALRIDSFKHRIGDRVVVEVSGIVKVRQENEHGQKYIVQPDNPRAAAVHASPEYVFPEDDDSEPVEPPPPADDEPAVEITDAGRAYLLLRDIVARLDIEGDQASFTITPELADELAAFGAEAENDEPEPDEDGHDAEADIWVETAN